ncbi:MAG TPA: hypothetical protein VKU19_39625 [Bryobacteraceae bacterium]|nr:hypothetical protein [Bryobacteraceae bacterium]
MISWLISFFATSLCAIGLMCISPELIHWMVVPVVASGTVVAVDAVDWLRGKLQPFDPAGVLGLLGVHVFYLCPLLVGGWGHRLRYLPDQPEDYRPWLGCLGVLCFIGLLIYRYALKTWSKPALFQSPEPGMWQINARRFWCFVLLGLIVSGGLQAWAYYSLGGIQGYIAEYSNWLKGQDAFQNTTAAFSISESFPILAIFAFAVWSWGARWRRSWWVVGIVLVVFFFLLLLFGGLRGSRSNTVWGLFWGVGVIHFWVRPVPRKLVLCGLPVLVLFMMAYAVYKTKGADTLSFVSTTSSYSEIADGTETTADVVMGDLGRSDVQAFLLYRLLGSQVPYDYALGRTYLGAICLLIPKTLWPSRPPSKLKWTTEAEYGVGSYDNSAVFQSSRVYGLVGETMLNFGPIFVPLAFVVLAVAISGLRRIMNTLNPGDSRLLIVPFLVNFCILLLINDSDNQIFFVVKYGAVPGILIALASHRTLSLAGQRRIVDDFKYSRY